MPQESIDRLTHEVGKLTGVMEGVIKSQDNNTVEIKHLSAYMNKTQGATEERDKHYKRVKHTAVGSAIIAVGTLIRTVFHS